MSVASNSDGSCHSTPRPSTANAAVLSVRFPAHHFCNKLPITSPVDVQTCSAVSVPGNSNKSCYSELRPGKAEAATGSLQPCSLYLPKHASSLSNSLTDRSHGAMRPPSAPNQPNAGSAARGTQASAGEMCTLLNTNHRFHAWSAEYRLGCLTIALDGKIGLS